MRNAERRQQISGLTVGVGVGVFQISGQGRGWKVGVGVFQISGSGLEIRLGVSNRGPGLTLSLSAAVPELKTKQEKSV